MTPAGPDPRAGVAGAPLSVALVSPGWPPSAFANGIIPYVASLAEQLRRQGQRATVLARDIIGEVGDDVMPIGRDGPDGLLDRVSWALRRRVDPEGYVDREAVSRLARAARRAASERGARLIEMEESFGWAEGVRRRVPMAMVVRLHGPWFLNGPHRGAVDDPAFRRRVRREGEAIRRADGVTAPSRDVLERTRAYYGLPLEHAEVIYPPAVEAGRWRREACDPDTILFVGRFDNHKGGDLVVDAFGLLASEDPAVRLRFVGPDANYIDPKGRRWSLPEYLRDRLPAAAASRVEWMGQQPADRLGALRRGAAAVVACSRYETFGLTLTEAMACGCPVVATRAGAFPELVEDGEDGLLCRPDDPADLARALRSLLDDPELAARLGHRAAEGAVGKYDPALLAAATARYYRRVLARREGGSPP